MSVQNLEKILSARQQQFGSMLDEAKAQTTNEDLLKILEAMFKYLSDTNKAIMAKLDDIDKKVSGEE